MVGKGNKLLNFKKLQVSKRPLMSYTFLNIENVRSTSHTLVQECERERAGDAERAGEPE